MLKRNAPYFIILVFFLAILPKFIAPINGLDAAWNFSNAVNLSGDFFNPYTNNIVSNLYCYTQSFIAFGFPNQYGSLIFHSIILLGYLLLIYGELGVSQKAFFLGLIVVTSYYFKLHRSEHVTLLIALIIYQSSFKNYKSFNRIFLISTIVFLLHPVHGLLTFVGLLAYEQSIWKNRLPLTVLGITAIVGLVAIHYFFPENTYSNSLLHRISNIGTAPLITFLKHGAITLLALCLFNFKQWNISFGIHLLALFALITLFGTANYYVFLFLPLFLYAVNNNTNLVLKPVLIGFISFSAIVNIVHPIYIQIENPNYGQVCRDIIRYNSELSARHIAGTKIYTENYFAPPLLKNLDARMMLIDKEQVLLVDSVSDGDMLLTYFRSKPKKIVAHLEKAYPGLTCKVIKMIPETPGNVTLTSLYQKRTESLGLWLVQVK